MAGFIGIDFGSSSCRSAYMTDELLVVIPNRFSEGTLPLLLESDGSAGSAGHGYTAGNRTDWMFSSIKQKIGFDETVAVGSKTRLMIDQAADIFRAIKEDAEKYMDEVFNGAVITVPSCFPEKQRAAIKSSAEKGGFGAVRLIDESFAVVLASDEARNKGTVLVYALGGGVFTASVFRINNGVPQPLWHEGDRRLGGNMFDSLIINYLSDKYNRLFSSGTSLVRNSNRLKLKKLAENAKIGLSGNSSVLVDKIYRCLDPPSVSGKQDETDMTITLDEFENLISQYIENTVTLMKKAVQNSGMDNRDIDAVILVGGSTRIPMVERLVRGCINSELLKLPDEITVKGAAIYGAGLPEKTQKRGDISQQKEKTPSQENTSAPVREIPYPHIAGMNWFNDWSVYIFDAELLWNRGDQDGAIHMLETMVNELPKFVATLYSKRGEMCLANDNVNEAIRYLESGFAHNSADHQIRKTLHKACRKKGQMLAEKGFLHDARYILKKGLKYTPECKGCKDYLNRIEYMLQPANEGVSKNAGMSRKKRKRK